MRVIMARSRGTAQVYAVVAAVICSSCASQCDGSKKQGPTRAVSSASASPAATAPASAEPPPPSASQQAPGQAMTGDRARATELSDNPPGVLAKLGSAEPIKTCSLDRVDRSAPKAAEIRRGTAAALQGWAADMKRQDVPPTLIIVLEGKTASYFAAGVRGPQRPDVAKMFKNEAYVDAGFRAVIDFADVVPGDYRVKIFQMSWAEKPTLCDTQKVVTVQ